MHYFLHGDHHLSSRNFLNDLLAKAKKSGKDIERLDGKTLELTDLIQLTSSQNLFGNDKIIIIEGLFSRIKSKAQTEILDWLKTYQGETPIVLWETKSIGKVLQRKLPQNTTVKQFKTPVIIFKLVESLNPKNKKQSLQLLDSSLKKEAAEFIFVMFARQIRILLLVKGKQKISGAPWMIGKFKKQAESFTPKQLISMYKNLYQIDKSIKTGKNIMPLSWHLSNLILNC